MGILGLKGLRCRPAMTFSSTLLTSVQFTSYDYIKPNLEEKHVQVIPFAIFSDNSPAIFKNFYCG